MQKLYNVKEHQRTEIVVPVVPKILIPIEIKNQLDFYIKNTPTEVQGIGTTLLVGNNVLITKLFLLEQEASAASSDLDQEAVSKLYNILTDDEMEHLNLWWHSHAAMSPFWSGTDEGTIAEIAKDTDWFLSMVGNHALQYTARLDVQKPFKTKIIPEIEIPLPKLPEKVSKALALEIKEKVKEKVFPVNHCSDYPYWGEEQFAYWDQKEKKWIDNTKISKEDEVEGKKFVQNYRNLGGI